ncbi:MAG: hypothetical protein WAU70_14165 [Flavobacteriales bacterium]
MHCWNINTLRALTLLALAGEARAQNVSDSPYSAYGFGDLVSSSQVAQSAMGSVGVAMVDPFSVISVNPASYTTLGSAVFEAGGSWRNTTLTTGTQEGKRGGVQFTGLSLGVPFGGRKWGIAMGLQPYTNVGYLVTQEGVTSTGSPVTYEYLGTGGINRAFLGLGRVLWNRRDSVGEDNRRRDTVALGNKLSLGLNFNYLFGGIEQTSKAIYPQSSGYYSTKNFTSLVLRDPSYTVGLLYSGQLVAWKREHTRLKRRGQRIRERLDAVNAALPDSLKKLDVSARRDTVAWGFHIGAISEFGADLGARYTGLLSTYTLSGGVEVLRDTISSTDGERGNVSLPPLFGLGIAFTHGSALTITAEMRQRDWRQLRSDVEGWTLPEDLGMQRSFAAGLAWRPAGSRIEDNILRNTVYRLGMRYTNDYLVVRGTQLNEMAVSAGLSLPVLAKFSRSSITIGGEYGQRGTTDNGLIKEQFTTLFVGITIAPDPREAWFVKRRID